MEEVNQDILTLTMLMRSRRMNDLCLKKNFYLDICYLLWPSSNCMYYCCWRMFKLIMNNIANYISNLFIIVWSILIYVMHTCRPVSFLEGNPSFWSKKREWFYHVCLFLRNLCIVMYRKFRNYPIFWHFYWFVPLSEIWKLVVMHDEVKQHWVIC